MYNMFKKKPEEYKAQIDPISQGIQQNALYLSKIKQISYEQALTIVKEHIGKNKPGTVKDPTIRYYDKNEVGDTVKKETSLSRYINRHTRDKNIIVPSLTTYYNHYAKKSLQSEYVLTNTRNRSVEKKKAFVAKSQGNTEAAKTHTSNQKKLKIDNNSLSGAYAINSTALGDKSAHYTLTSITRCISSIGNAVTEAMVAGNIHYRDPMLTRNHLVSLLSNTNRTLITKAMEEYKLYIPTDLEILETILRSTRLYWTDLEQEKKLLSFINTLNDVDRCIVTYVNNLYNLRIFNNDLIFNLIDSMSNKLTKSDTFKTDEETLKYVNSSFDWVLNTVHHILIEDIKGIDVKYDKLIGTPLLDSIAATAENVYNTLENNALLIKAFFVSTNLPPSVAYFPDITRRVTVLSDTDSTCATYQEWVQWFNKGEMKFDEKAVGVAVSVLTIVTQTLDHILNQFSTNMNIPYEKVGLLAMKNEFFWKTMTPMLVSKHYHADTCIQEGVSFTDNHADKLELKGVQMIASAIPKKYKEISMQMMKEGNETVANGGKIDILKYLKLVASLEKEIRARVLSLDTEILKIEKIKDSGAYKLTPDRSPYINHLLWQEVFSPKYGNADKPPYTAVKVPTIISSKRHMEEFLDKVEDKALKERFVKFLTKYKKEKVSSFKVPLSVTEDGIIPEEFIHIIDSNRIVFDIMNVFYLILEGWGFLRKPDMPICDLGY